MPFLPVCTCTGMLWGDLYLYSCCYQRAVRSSEVIKTVCLYMRQQPAVLCTDRQTVCTASGGLAVLLKITQEDAVKRSCECVYCSVYQEYLVD